MRSGIFCLVLAVASILTTKAQAVQWSELEVGGRYAFQMNLRLQDSGNSNLYLEIIPGTTATLIEYMPLDEIDVGFWRFKVPCKFPNDQIAMSLFEPAHRDYEIGIALEPGCILEVFADLSEYYKESLF